jgi:hypothetical protein
MRNVMYVPVGQFDSKGDVDSALLALEKSGFNYKKLFTVRAEDASGLRKSRRRLKKSVAAGLILGSLLGSWIGKAVVVIPSFLSFLGGSPPVMRGLATLEYALIAGALGALGAVLYNAHAARLHGIPQKGESRRAPFLIEVRGTPEETSKAQAVLESRQLPRRNAA